MRLSKTPVEGASDNNNNSEEKDVEESNVSEKRSICKYYVQVL